jgi:hypothetical protein
MFFGDIVTITSNGVLAREKALEPVGIFHDSICWGMWAANPHYPHRHPGHPNLIISPFHPSSWPFLVRLRLVLENRQGILARAARLLEENDLSIVFAGCTPTGFTHATWTVIAESTWQGLDEVRIQKEKFDRQHSAVRIPSVESYSGARKLANDIAARMLAHVRRLEAKFEGVVAAQRGSDDPIFHVWSAEGDSHFLYNGDEVARGMEELGEGTLQRNRDYIRLGIPGPAEVSYMQRLAYFSIYGGGGFDEVPFRFKYNADTTLIKMERGIPFAEGSFKSKLSSLPMHAIGTFNSEDKYLRLCPVTPDFLSQPLTRIVVEYAVEQSAHNAKASQGLLRRVCDALRPDVDLLQISNKWTSHDYADQAGEISFIADVEPTQQEKLERRLKAINDADKDERLEAVTIKKARVVEYPQKKLFFSYHWGHPREDCIRQLVVRAALAEGFMYVEVRTYIGSVTNKVDEQIEGCQAFLQLLSSDDDPSLSYPPPWIQHEYSTALAKGKPTFQLVDVSKFNLAKWKMHYPVNADQALRPFRLDLSDDDLYEVIREAVKELAQTRGKS